MRKYEIRPMTRPLPELVGEVFDPEMEEYCEDPPFAPNDCYVWGGDGTSLREIA